MYIVTIKNHVKIFCCLMIILITSTKAIAQNDFVPKIVPPSPEAASLGKFVEVPVSHYTGLPNISVPLYTIESGEIKLPIQVSYHARGIQVSEMAPQVGTGWALNAGGVITRQQRGAADESYNGYLKENFYDTFYTSQETRARVMAGSTAGIESDRLMDMEPDVYFFNFLNFSGKFIFDQKTKKPVIQKYSDFKIEPKFEDGYYITGWVITDKDGIKYYFGTSKDGSRKAIDKPEGSSSSQFMAVGGLQNSTVNITYNNAWQLMDIVTPSNKVIKFEYLKERPDYFSRSFDDGQGFYLTSHFSKIFMNQYHIKTITFDKGKVVFTKFATQREDLRNSYALQKVEVFGSDGLLKVKHSFNYTYTNSEDTNSLLHLRNSEPQAKKRLFLESIVSEGSKTTNTNKGKKYSFVYDPQILPNRFSTAQDNWGYYNGKDNGEYSSFFEGDNRQVDTIKSQAGMLKKIIYPTGGSATFEYEHNTVIPPPFYQELLINPTTPTEHKVGNIFKDPSLYDSTRGVFVSKPFTVTLGQETSTVNALSFSSFAGDTSTCSSTMTNYGCPFEVSVYKLNPKTSVGSLFIGRGSINLDSGEYVIEVRPKTPEGRDLTDYEKGAFSVSLSWEQPSSNPKEILFAAGKRIKRIIWDDNLGGVTSKSYKYLDSSGKSSGKTFSIPNMYYIMGMYNNTPIINQIGATAGSPLTNFQGNALGYSVVTEINGEAGNNIGKTEYNFTMPEDSGDFYKFPYHSPTDNEWLRGMPLSIKYYSNNAGSYSLVKEVKNKYIYGDEAFGPLYFTEMIDPDLPYLYLNHRRKFSLPLAIFIKDETLTGNAAYENPNSYKIFYTTGGTVDLYSSVETEILKNAKEYKKTTNYFYNYDSNYQLKRSQTQTSSQETLETKYFYAPDPEMASEPFRSDLIANNMIGIPLDTQTFNNSVKLSEQKTVYDNSAATSNLLLPRYIYSNKGTDNISTTKDEKIAFDKYDDQGNVLQYTPKGGVPVSIIWGYNKTQPIAKIENITYDKIVNYVVNLQNKSNADNDNCIATSCTEQLLRKDLNALRTAFSGNMITTYTYDPSIGVTSITDPKEKTIYYEYDSFGRLKFVKDNEFNVLEKYCYNYKGEQTDCSDDSDSAGVLYRSAALNGSFTRNDCGEGAVGSTVSFSLPAEAIISLVSQADADAQAQMQFNSEGQAYANTNGTCTFTSIAKSGSFTKNNCSGGAVGSAVVYNVPAGRYTSTTSQAAADALAQTDVNNNGQAYANTNGTCTYSNIVKSGSFTKNNCASGGVGSVVVYTVLAGRYTSTTSQAAADALAQTDVNNNGQTNANTNGTCTFSSIARSGSFTKNNCAVGGVGSSVAFSQAVGAQISIISQADADAKGLTLFNTNGQANANTNGTCTFSNIVKSGSFTKNNCVVGGVGSPVVYTVPAGTYTSTTSQAAADALAQTDVNNNGQANANTNGTCTFSSIAKSGTFTRNNCTISGTVGSVETYTVAAGSYTSTVSQAAADALAQTAVNNNGQSYANTNGKCLFKSVAKSKTLTKNDCVGGSIGSVETYALPAGAYSSEISQADADKKAQDVIDAIAQSYVNDIGTCLFYSVAKSGSFTKNNCAAGGVGSVVVYTVPVKQYSSSVSQAAADALAQTDVNNNGQAYANTNGTCTFSSIVKSGSFTKNNCASGGVGSVVVYTVPAGRYTSTTSQAVADGLAQTDVNTNGQTNANTNGTCTFSSIARSGSFAKNNCAAGGVGSSVAFSQAVGAQTSIISQADADAKGLTLFNTNGQANANTSGTCTFSNIVKSGSFTKNNCVVGGAGSVVIYTVPAGTYTSTTSQAAADALAQTDVNNNGQANANTNGICTFSNIVKSGNFTRNNCAIAGTVGSVETYTVAAGSYTSTVSQAAADNLAQTAVNNNGQNYANTNGKCLFKSVAKSKTLTKNDCTGGSTGSVETYALPAGAYSSEISQADADKKAQDVIDALAQSYVNDIGTCLFYSVVKSGSFTKNNCAAGGVGSVVVYTVPAKQYSSAVSQAAADALAQTDVNNNGQAYANTNGTCTFSSIVKSGSFTKNNCASGGVGSVVVYTVPAGRYTSTTSQAAADALAQTDVNNNGQTNANTNGTCTFSSIARSGSFAKNNCAAGGVGSSVAFSQAVGAQTSIISQADADAKGLTLFNTNGQANANTNGTCTFTSVVKSGSFTKNNCAAGGAGSVVVYTVPAGSYTSTTSQAAADALAQTDVNNNGQANANTNGTCTFSSIARSSSFTKNNCAAGGVPSSVAFSQVVGAQTSLISQADADSKGLTLFNTNGQANANTNGTCTFSSIARSGNFTKNNCAAGGVGSSVAFSQAVGAQTSIISQADADSKGLTLFNTNGQANANTNGTCTFSSVVKSGSFTKNNCAAGGVGSAVVYIVPAGTYTSTISQAAADALAQTDVNNNGQANANTNGICTFSSIAKSGTFTRNNCTGGTVGSVETYTVPAGSYTSTTSQAAADALAQAAVNNNGQNYANSNGRCLFKSVAKSKTLTKNDCSGGSTGSIETFSLPAGAYSSEISQADADKKAQDVIDATAQSYVNDIGTCLFYSVAKSGSFTKNNCSGGTASTVVYTVPARQYNSAVSQAAADALAQTDVNNNGQAYANANGTCTFYNVLKSGTYTRNNCGATAVSSGSVVYTVAAGKYSSVVSQAAADNLAQDELNANGQNTANAQGICTFKNVLMSKVFTKAGCPVGYDGTMVSYSVAAGLFTSTISQADADAKALAELNSKGQANANTKGSCLLRPDEN